MAFPAGQAYFPVALASTGTVVSTTVSTDSDVTTSEFCSYETFGRRFFEHAVTIERIKHGVSGLTGKPIEFGPLGVGPAKIAKVTAHGTIAEPTVTKLPGEEPLRFLLHIPVDLKFVVGLPATDHRFRADVEIELKLTARAAEPLRIVIEIDPPDRKSVTLKLRAEGIASTVLQLVSGMDYEVKRFLVRYISKEIDKEHIRDARDVDLVPKVDAHQH